jgi:hypothetical protein
MRGYFQPLKKCNFAVPSFNQVFPAHTTISVQLQRPINWMEKVMMSPAVYPTAQYLDAGHTSAGTNLKPAGARLLIKKAKITGEQVGLF